MTAWSYSSIKTFEQCPKKYFHLKIAKDVKDEPGEAAEYGTAVHLAAEEFIRDGKPIPDKFAFMRPIVEPLAAKQGEKHTELRLGVAKTDTGFAPTTFFAKDVWYRGIVDLLIVDGTKGWMIDYKTGKNAKYADTKQLDILAAAVFTRFPQLRKLKSALAFVVSNEFVKKEHTSDLSKSYFATFTPELDRLSVAENTGVWNANSGPLCKFCPVTTCEHNRR